jgi:Ca2+-binding RTX toxin-like protein
MAIKLLAPDAVANSTMQGSQLEPTTCALSDGRIVFAWQSSDGGEAGSGFLSSGLRARILGANGTWTTADFYLNATTQGAQSAPVLLGTAAGFAAVWQSDDGADGSGSLIRFRLFKADGSSSLNDIVINTTSAGQQTAPKIKELENGNFVVVWQSTDTANDADSGCIRGRLISSTGNPIADDFVINTTYTALQSEPVVTSLANGNFVATWMSKDPGDSSGSCIRARIFTADGAALGNDFIINSSTTSTQTSPSLASSGNGFVAVWESDDGGEGPFQVTSIRARFFDAKGKPTDTDVIVNTTTQSFQKNPAVAALPDGRYFVVWESEDGGDGSGNCIRGRMISSSGELLDKDFIINTTAASVQYAPSLSVTPDDKIAITWVSYDDADGAAPLIRSVRYDATTFEGDVNSNKWHGGSFGDKIFGKGGNDQLYGHDASDRLIGEAGDDTLYGGSSADQLDGGIGDDTASYHDGSAISIALDKSFAATGAAVGDILKSIENLEGSKASDKLGGNSGANIVTGHGGHDNLLGRAGNDLLIGGTGSDILNGGAGRDDLFGGSGTDTASYVDDAGVSASLDGSISQTGAAAGDIYASIENLAGSGSGADRLAGNALSNRLTGYSGNDTLSGQGGKDTLYGGRGADTLKGGIGSDTFAYAAIDEGGDTIMDFTASDSFTFKSQSFASLSRGKIDAEVFQVSKTNKALTTQVHFIFETDVNVLWFDSNGKSAGGLIKIAKLSGTYDITASDIVIV